MNSNLFAIRTHLVELYGETDGLKAFDILEHRLDMYRVSPVTAFTLSEQDAILITYGDQVRAEGELPLKTLVNLSKKYLKGLIRGIHLMPFFPYSSDDGFSVINYRLVDPALGTWADIHALGAAFRLMFDAVINHVSVQSEWFQGFLLADSMYHDYFITVNGNPDLSQVVRPRALPLLTHFETHSGPEQVWTTFSTDQVDLNYKNPEVLVEILDILLFYVAQGAALIRLDAIAYLWKEIGTSCIHLPQTHRIIQLMRAVLDEVAPHAQLITETNVLHDDNISYFGDGTNEAQLVYNFALPPLMLHTFHTGDARILSDWAATLALPSAKTTFFNFLASHDGIGLNPARGILSSAQVDALVKKTLAHGGLVSYKHNADGTQSPYEMNINYFDALSNPHGSEPLTLQVDRFIASQAVMLALVGVPGIYFHSLFGSRGWPEGVKLTGRNRTINRQKCQRDELEAQLGDTDSLRARVFSRFSRLLKARSGDLAFHPHGKQSLMNMHPSVFAIERASPDGKSYVLCLHNVSGQKTSFTTKYESAVNLFTGHTLPVSNLALEPYQVLWLKLI